MINEELIQTYEALCVILEDERSFAKVNREVFKALDKDNSGSITLEEIKSFLSSTSIKMDDLTFKEVFAELDEDKSNEINLEELGVFLRKLFTC